MHQKGDTPVKIAKNRALPLLCCVVACLAPWMLSAQERVKQPLVWQPLPNSQCDGLFAERVNLWRDGRLWYMLTAEDDYLLSGFEDRPGVHGWQGEHVGKWLHAATLAYQQTGDEKLLAALHDVANRLVATQEADGYLGTYRRNFRFTAKPENGVDSDIADDLEPVKKGQRHGGAGWDTWTFRYNLYGLLTYEKFHANPKVVDACRKMADLLIGTYGEGKYDLTKYGTRRGISATTLLESIMMLYARTHEEKYLNFAEHIVSLQENKEDLRIMGNMLERGSVTKSGEGKAYQFLANLLGYVLLYQHTGDQKYLQTAVIGWEEVRDKHIDVAGGPWGRRAPYNGHRECFAKPQDYDPGIADIETCSTTTWVQLCLHLFELTGESRYRLEAERSMFNALMAAQYPQGLDWCYYLKVNQNRRPYETKITCCSSSGSSRSLQPNTVSVVLGACTVWILQMGVAGQNKPGPIVGRDSIGSDDCKAHCPQPTPQRMTY
jgi:DUF1680 family protein